MSWRLIGLAAVVPLPVGLVEPAEGLGHEVAVERQLLRGSRTVGDHEAGSAATGADLARLGGRRRLGEHRPASVGAGDGRLQAGRDLARAVEHAVGVEPARPGVTVPGHRPVALQADGRVGPRRPATTGRRVEGDDGPAVGHPDRWARRGSSSNRRRCLGRRVWRRRHRWARVSLDGGFGQIGSTAAQAGDQQGADEAAGQESTRTHAPLTPGAVIAFRLTRLPQSVSTVSATAMAASRSKADSSR